MPRKKLFTDEELRARKNARTAQRYIENKEKINAYHAALHQSRKNDPEYMKKMAEKSAAYRIANPGVVSNQNRKRRLADPEKSRRESREWFAKNPDKRLIYQHNRESKINKSGRLSAGLAQRLYKAQRGKCACCGKPLGDDYHLDHIMPLALGGSNTDDNMQLLTSTCNMQKHAKHPVEFMQSRGFLL